MVQDQGINGAGHGSLVWYVSIISYLLENALLVLKEFVDAFAVVISLQMFDQTSLICVLFRAGLASPVVPNVSAILVSIKFSRAEESFATKITNVLEFLDMFLVDVIGQISLFEETFATNVAHKVVLFCVIDHDVSEKKNDIAGQLKITKIQCKPLHMKC